MSASKRTITKQTTPTEQPAPPFEVSIPEGMQEVTLEQIKNEEQPTRKRRSKYATPEEAHEAKLQRMREWRAKNKGKPKKHPIKIDCISEESKEEMLFLLKDMTQDPDTELSDELRQVLEELTKDVVLPPLEDDDENSEEVEAALLELEKEKERLKSLKAKRA